MHLKPREGGFLTYCLNWCNNILNYFVPPCPFGLRFTGQELPAGLRGYFSVLFSHIGICPLGARMKSVHFIDRRDYSWRIVVAFNH